MRHFLFDLKQMENMKERKLKDFSCVKMGSVYVACFIIYFKSSTTGSVDALAKLARIRHSSSVKQKSVGLKSYFVSLQRLSQQKQSKSYHFPHRPRKMRILKCSVTHAHRQTHTTTHNNSKCRRTNVPQISFIRWCASSFSPHWIMTRMAWIGIKFEVKNSSVGRLVWLCQHSEKTTKKTNSMKQFFTEAKTEREEVSCFEIPFHIDCWIRIRLIRHFHPINVCKRMRKWSDA